MTNLECALTVLCSDYVELNKVPLPFDETPEKALLAKESFITLSEEANTLIQLIINAPERIYMANGVINPRELRKYCRRRKGWSLKKLEEVKFELWFFLRAMSLK